MIVTTLGDVMEHRGVSGKELAERVGISAVNLSRIKTGKAKAVKIALIDAFCRELDCQPKDLIKYVRD